MKVLVPVKRVVDYNVRIRVNPDGSGVDLAGARMAMNPFDEIGLEEAVRLREGGYATEVVAVSCGGRACEDTLRTALAVGADRAILVESNEELQPLAVAKLLKAIALQERVQLVLMGKQAIDDDACQVGQMLAAMLGWPQATFVSKLLHEEGHLRVTRELDGGTEIVEISLPALVTADLRLNEPRYATLPNIMKARKKAITVLQAAELGVDLKPRLRTLEVLAPPERRQGIMVTDVAELVMALRACE